MHKETSRVAVVQHPPVLLDRQKTIERTVGLLKEAAGQGAELVVFPETFLPGYPAWVWTTTPSQWDLNSDLFQRLQTNSIDLNAGDLDPICEAARELAVTVVIGIDERDAQYGRSTLYNTLVTIGPDGGILNVHRKLMPTNPERMIWGLGDGRGLRVSNTPVGRVGGLICWENYMPLARFALYAQGVEIYVASTWDEGEMWLTTMRHIAKEGRCWVLGSSSCIQGRDLPDDLPGKDCMAATPDEWVNDGGSVIVDPTGKIVAGPLVQQHGILYADCDPATAHAARRTFDVSGHYNRPDVLKLSVERGVPAPVEFRDPELV